MIIEIKVIINVKVHHLILSQPEMITIMHVFSNKTFVSPQPIITVKVHLFILFFFSQLHQSRLGLLSQALMMMVTVGFLFR